MNKFPGIGLCACVLGMLVSSSALAQTNISGGNIVDETWTKVGNPYVISGDIIVPAGAFLNITQGVDIQIAAGDQQTSLPDTGRVAITVRGDLTVSGTEAEPVRIHAQTGTSVDTWHGLVVESGATTASFDWMILEHARYGLDTDNSVLEVRVPTAAHAAVATTRTRTPTVVAASPKATRPCPRRRCGSWAPRSSLRCDGAGADDQSAQRKPVSAGGYM